MVLSRRDSTIVARHEVPGIMRKIARPSGTIEPIPSDPNFQQEYLAFLKRPEHSTRCRLLMPGLSFDDKYLGLTMTSTVPPGRNSLHRYTQALRAWLLSPVPPGRTLDITLKDSGAPSGSDTIKLRFAG